MFITSGMRADWLTCAVRTAGPGAAGISLLLIAMDSSGVERTRLDKMGWRCSDTAAIHFADVRVPAENLIGPENGGFRSEEHTSELQSLMRISYAVFCLKKKKIQNNTQN